MGVSIDEKTRSNPIILLSNRYHRGSSASQAGDPSVIISDLIILMVGSSKRDIWQTLPFGFWKSLVLGLSVSKMENSPETITKTHP